jgi:hypothetical protein
MKKLSILFVSVLALGMSFVSCSKDDKDPSIEGKWTATDIKFSIDGGITYKNEEPDNTPGCSKDFTEFASKGVVNFVGYLDKCVEDKTSGTWSQAGSTLTVKSEGDTETINVDSLTDSTLVLKYTETDPDTKITEIAIITYARM